MSSSERFSTILLALVMVAALMFFSINIGKDLALKEKQYTLKPYNGVGSMVYKHGTIVKVNEDGQPVVVGSFHDDSGAEYPGTVQIEEVK